MVGYAIGSRIRATGRRPPRPEMLQLLFVDPQADVRFNARSGLRSNIARCGH